MLFTYQVNVLISVLLIGIVSSKGRLQRSTRATPTTSNPTGTNKLTSSLNSTATNHSEETSSELSTEMHPAVNDFESKAIFPASDAFLVKLESCTGTLIADDWVLTAAHCFASKTSEDGWTKNGHDHEYVLSDENRPNDVKAVGYAEKITSLKANRNELWTTPLPSPSPENAADETPENSQGNDYNNANRQDPEDDRDETNTGNAENDIQDDNQEEGGDQAGGGGEEEEGESGENYWRGIERIIVNGGFQNESLSWKGSDFALIKLSQNDYGKEELNVTGGKIMPICLAQSGFREQENNYSDDTFMAGFGRREIPYCITDERGPEAYQLCGMDKECSGKHRTTECNLEFLYNRNTYNNCIASEPSPSSKDSDCKKLRTSNPDTKSVTVHLLKDKSTYFKTCYPEEIQGSKGWCTTRKSGIDRDSEPTATRGWGFCSDDPAQKNCNGQIKPISDYSPNGASVLPDGYCVDALKDNLRVEQPNVRQPAFDPLKKNHVFCVGRNHKHSFENEQFYIMQGRSKPPFLKHKSTSELEKSLYDNKKVETHHIDGGPACFGDSGGPVWRMAEDKKNGKQIPVLIGVFSFTLWGTCHGAQEPAYYGRVSDFTNWIYKYVPKANTCTFGKVFTDNRKRGSNPRPKRV